jgi:hypothetical protein
MKLPIRRHRPPLDLCARRDQSLLVVPRTITELHILRYHGF